MYKEEKEKVKQNLATARRITTGLDIWTKKGLTASFLGVSACYFNPEDNKAEHKLLNLKEMAHPHTAESISAVVLNLWVPTQKWVADPFWVGRGQLVKKSK